MQQMQQQVQGMQEEIKKLKGDLQTADREAQHAKKRVEIEKFKTSLKGVQNRSEKAGELYEQRLGDRLKEMDKEVKKEMDQGGPEQQQQPAGDLLSQL
jgi:hypothetical protein